MKYRDVLTFARELRKNQTPAEKLFWLNVRNRKFYGYKFNRQKIIEYFQYNNDKYFYIVDFYCHEKRLIVEIDGGIHYYQEEYDMRREAVLKGLGNKIIRFRNEEVLNDWRDVSKRLLALMKKI